MRNPSHAPEWRTERFDVVRIEQASDLPRPDRRVTEVALLDMNHGYANVGHDAIVALVRDAVVALDDKLMHENRRVRVLSYAVRDRLMVPDHATGRHRLYLGTGGPGHLDPRLNTHDRGAQEISEDPSWEAPLWRLFEAIASDEDAAMYAVCHTFGLMCRWSGAAQPSLRGPEKGGPMSGVGTNVLTPEAIAHPWFASLASGDTRGAVPVLDSRYYDLIPTGAGFGTGAIPIAYEASRHGDGAGDALTMLELAREADGTAPRMFGVNSHPEIGTSERVRELRDRMLASGVLSAEVHEQRSAMLPMLRNERRDERLAVGRRVFGELVQRKLDRLVHAA
ncbi:MAG: hypothetical protein IAI50_07615 [Candidatus Eremiobacteraeota bacterium]|nr:hypothetical protein [Candidatus Eremiobacteraeota bacterium]